MFTRYKVLIKRGARVGWLLDGVCVSGVVMGTTAVLPMLEVRTIVHMYRHIRVFRYNVKERSEKMKRGLHVYEKAVCSLLSACIWFWSVECSRQQKKE